MVPPDKSTAARRSPWGVMLLLVIAVVGAFFVQQALQPEFAADARHCVSREGTALVNTCDERINVTVCLPADAAEHDCRQYLLDPGQTTATLTGAPGRQIDSNVYACMAPFVPERRRNINNASLWEDGCAPG